MAASYAPGPASEAGGPAHAVDVVERVRRARRDPARVLLEGVHACKHAARFGADLELVLTPDADALGRLLAELAPDVHLPAVEVTPATWRAATGRELPSPALGVARRPAPASPTRIPAGPGRVVVLEQPRHLGNLGAAVRVAAAADAAGVLVVGDADPWHPTAVRAAAGLQFALPVARLATLPATPREIVAVDPGASPDRRLAPSQVPPDALLCFGTERSGLSPALRARATASVAIPMRAGVSSLNLATAVAVLLYA